MIVLGSQRIMKFLSSLALVSSLSTLAFAAPTSSDQFSSIPGASSGQINTDGGGGGYSKAGAPRRTVVYWQTEEGDPALIAGYATNLIVAAIHINNDSISINDTPYQKSKIWEQLEPLKQKGLTITGLVGGAAMGSFQMLELDFEKYYGMLKRMFKYTKLQGIDIDIEEVVSQTTIEKLLKRLKGDFGPDFVISFAPVPNSLISGDFSGIDYQKLEEEMGDDIDFYNTQFYCGNGDLTAENYMAILNGGIFPPEKVVAGVLTNPLNCESGGYIDPERGLAGRIIPNLLKLTDGRLGGIAGWEYFDSLPGGKKHPEKWAQIVSKALNPDSGSASNKSSVSTTPSKSMSDSEVANATTAPATATSPPSASMTSDSHKTSPPYALLTGFVLLLLHSAFGLL